MFGFIRGNIGVVSALAIAAMVGGALADAAPVSAAQIGTAVVNGRTVILDENGTWTYKDAADGPADAQCDNVGATKLCVKNMGWKPLPKRGDFQAMYSYGAKYYFGVIPEEYGTDDGVTAKSLRAAFIANAAAGSKTTPERIPVLASEDQVKGHPELKSLTYLMSDANNPTLTFVFHNVFQLDKKKSVQYVFWGVGKDVSTDFASVISQTLEQITVK